MQRVTCTVRLGGDLNNTVIKHNVSPAEIVVLNEIHGPGSVTDIKRTMMDKMPHLDERSRLSTTYGEHVIDRLFPGQFSKLPVSLSDINIEGASASEAEPADDDADTDATAAAAFVAPQAEPSAMDEDDKVLHDEIMSAPTANDLYIIAKDNEVDLNGVADTPDAIRAALVAALLPGKV